MGGRFLFALLLVPAWPAAAAEQQVTLPSTPGALYGTLLSSGTAGPAILMIAGSGPTDRDGNSQAGLRTDSYKLLAEGLAAKGITSLRVDKRGIAQSSAAGPAEIDLRFQTYADDAKAWAAELRRRTGLSCVWLLGHSEGALVAEVAAQDARGICGLALISGAGRKASDVLRIQMGPQLPDPLKQQAFDTIAQLEKGQLVPNPPPELMALFRPSVQPYLISWFAIDPASLLSKVKLPVLILQGNTDIQVSVEDAKLLAAAKPDAKLVILDGVNHVLKSAPAARAANVATYSDPHLPLAPGVADAVADFVQGHKP
ncbi:MAG TPA: alpha/beta fold hydrolase [Rhizomicrobium sp.]|jgi:pimeloyl-ACP methyl ester carboxylesterase|nr:alpha/beta fold hydrolase [Rhizomicrobium sp.]